MNEIKVCFVGIGSIAKRHIRNIKTFLKDYDVTIDAYRSSKRSLGTDIGEYVTSMVFISLPIIIYMSCFGLIDDRTKKLEPVFNNDSFTVLDIPVTILLIVMICLISGFFTFSMMGVGSSSMSPKINRGDAVILQKISDKTDLKKGDIIAFQRDKKIIVHRIHDVSESRGNEVFITKGDANNSVDNMVVERKQIKGKSGKPALTKK